MQMVTNISVLMTSINQIKQVYTNSTSFGNQLAQNSFMQTVATKSLLNIMILDSFYLSIPITYELQALI